jgi:hypothetical protein
LAELVEREGLLRSEIIDSRQPEEKSNGNGTFVNQEQKTPGIEQPTRVHYSESTTDTKIPKHIIQIHFDKEKVDEKKVRGHAAANLNAELRTDSKNSLLIFQSKEAAEKALASNPFKPVFNATLDKWSPTFFPTSMF